MAQARGGGSRRSWGVEWLRFSDRYGARQVPLPRFLTHLKREISEKTWDEARCCTERWVTGKEHRLPGQMERWMVHM